MQMNVRLDDELKRAGDAALESIGYTPTQAVRTVWEFAARNAGDPSVLREMLDDMYEPDAQDEKARKLELVRKGPDIYRKIMMEYGIDDPPPFTDDDLEKIKELHFIEKYGLYQ